MELDPGETIRQESDRPPSRRGPRWRRWPEQVGYIAAAWSAAYGALGLYWASGGAGFPFGVGHDPGAHLSVLAGAEPARTGPVIAVLGVVGAVVGLFAARGRGRGAHRASVIAFAWVAAAGLALIIPDFRILVVIAYAPILIVGAPFGWPADARLSEAIPWPLINQAVCIAGGVLWAATAIAYQRRSRDACGHCGRADAVARWTSPDAARRWGRVAVGVAVIVPVVYALTRWAWALGFPLGVTDELYREGEATGLWWIGAALATLALVGAILTVGLIKPWGEFFPGWLPLVGGRLVPPGLVLIPAILVAVVVTAAGIMFVRMAAAGTFVLGRHAVTLEENWGALAPELLWPIWGVALGAAALGYHYRRRGRCSSCGRL